MLLIGHFLKTKRFTTFYVHLLFLFNSLFITILGIFAMLSVSNTAFQAVSYFMYFFVPFYALYISYKKIDAYKLNLIRNLLFISSPIIIVAFIQKFFDNSFLVNTSYSETGAVIFRNTFDGGFFARYPSIYASADRFSAVSLCLFIISVQAYIISKNKSDKLGFIFFGILFLFGIVIAGARSRLLVLVIPITFMLYFMVINALRLRTNLVGAGVILVFTTVTITFVNSDNFKENFEVIMFMIETFNNNDIYGRLLQAYIESTPSNVSEFSYNLGYDANGKPGEFTFRSLAIDLGTFGQSIFFMLFSILLTVFVMMFTLSVLSHDRRLIVFFAFFITYFLFGIITGLTGILELSSGLLMFGVILPKELEYWSLKVEGEKNG